MTLNKITMFFCVLILLVLSSCNSTDNDKIWSEKMFGYWAAVDTEGNNLADVPFYKFEANNKGKSFGSANFNNADSFKWEVVRKQLKIYYFNPPSYYIAYDKYNMRSLLLIDNFSDTLINVTQFYNTGYQRVFELKKFSVSE